MIRVCDICGEEYEDRWMQSMFTGTKTMWLCWGCYKNSQREATLSDLYRQKRLYKLAESKKRNK